MVDIIGSGTERAIEKTLTKMKLEPGDILIVSDANTAEALAHMRINYPFWIPMIYAPDGISKMTIAEAKEALSMIVQLEDMVAQTAAVPSQGEA